MKDLSKRMDELEDDKGGDKLVLPTPKMIGARKITERASSMIEFKNEDLKAPPERQKSRQAL